MSELLTPVREVAHSNPLATLARATSGGVRHPRRPPHEGASRCSLLFPSCPSCAFPIPITNDILSWFALFGITAVAVYSPFHQWKGMLPASLRPSIGILWA